MFLIPDERGKLCREIDINYGDGGKLCGFAVEMS